jgi:hypothetical protein
MVDRRDEALIHPAFAVPRLTYRGLSDDSIGPHSVRCVQAGDRPLPQPRAFSRSQGGARKKRRSPPSRAGRRRCIRVRRHVPQLAPCFSLTQAQLPSRRPRCLLRTRPG